MKIISSILLLANICIFTNIQICTAWNIQADENYFIVTAYYSPLPDQENYLTGNYWDEIILNWAWIAGASGKKVFSGMLAAPWKYNFGTKIELEWLWIWEVADRGGAIVPAGQRWYNHDRIDIWMWYWDEWLKRALYWGKRKVTWKIISTDSNITLDYSIIPSPHWISVGKDDSTDIHISENTQQKDITVFDINLGIESSWTLVAELQTLLSDLWYIENDYIVGVYDMKTIEAITRFQLNTWVIQTEKNIWSGVYGPKTRTQMSKSYDKFLEQQLKIQEFKNTITIIQETARKEAQESIENIWNVSFWDIGQGVRELQKTLEILGYFNYNDTAIFWAKTQNALINFQIDSHIISNEIDVSAWIFGPNTQEAMISELSQINFTQKLIDEDILKKYITYIKYENKKTLAKIEKEKVTKWNQNEISTKKI